MWLKTYKSIVKLFDYEIMGQALNSWASNTLAKWGFLEVEQL